MGHTMEGTRLGRSVVNNYSMHKESCIGGLQLGELMRGQNLVARRVVEYDVPAKEAPGTRIRDLHQQPEG